MEFKREERYIVIKRKHLPFWKESQLRTVMEDFGIEPLECVVVEKGLPNYEQTWRDLEKVYHGEYADNEKRDSLLAHVEQLLDEISAEIFNNTDITQQTGNLYQYAILADKLVESIREENLNAK
jgi:hypothetical protein